jgi:hypothetical protein
VFSLFPYGKALSIAVDHAPGSCMVRSTSLAILNCKRRSGLPFSVCLTLQSSPLLLPSRRTDTFPLDLQHHLKTISGLTAAAVVQKRPCCPPPYPLLLQTIIVVRMKNKRRTSGSLDNNLADRYVVQLYKNNPQFIALLSNPADLTVIFSNIELISPFLGIKARQRVQKRWTPPKRWSSIPGHGSVSEDLHSLLFQPASS